MEAKDDKGGKRGGVLVIGLGRFGSAVATTLDRLGQDVLGVEKDPELVSEWSAQIPVVEADAANPVALDQLGAADFATAVVGVGTEIESSVLITGNLLDMGVPQVWAKAISPQHGRILERIGAHHVISPESDAGERVAHLLSERLLDYIEVEADFAIVKMRPPKEVQRFTLAQSRVAERYGVTVIGVKSPGETFQYATAEMKILPDDVLIVSGPPVLIERFASRPA